MQSVQAGMWDPRPPSKHVSPSDSSHPPRLTHVSAPAKRITFYRSGDSQFGGVKMAVHKRSFKCFDALLDDLSQKVPLPFGVRTVTTPRGTRTIRHIEQLQDGGCYLCSDRRQAKPINMDIAAKRPGVWYHHGSRPHRPESSSATPPGHVPYRQRRLLLVKNTEPGVRRSIVLSRRITRSLRAFLEEASDVMQFHVRKIYTMEGRKIDNIQSLMTCPNVLVCVGREAFSPLLVNYIRKSSDEKLPGLGPRTPGNGARSPPHGAQSRASEHSEGQDSKKNTINFGLETKKSIIHPRSDSSNRSARFSVSSEKSYGISALSQGRNGIMNDDIEKRVVVNKDGSLSVEMRVRFRLHSDETLQWSTQIKKSPSLTNETCSISQSQSHYLQQGQSESCSDPDCNSFEPEVADYASQCPMEGNSCPCCYRHEQQFDLWENPAHCLKQPVPPSHTTSQSHTKTRHTHSSSSSSSCNSRRVVRCRATLTNKGSEHNEIVQEEMCVTEEVEHIVEQEVEVCTVSRSCSQNEVVTIERPQSGKSGEDELERPTSAVSASSHVLQELKEDDDDEEELPPSASRCCHSNELSRTPEIQIDDKPASIASANNKQDGGDEKEASACHCLVTSGAETSERASKAYCRSSKNQETADLEVEEVKRVVSGLSASSRQSATSLCPNCGGWKQKAGSEFNSRASHHSHQSTNVTPKPATPQDDGNDANDNASDVSTHSNKSNLTNHGRASAISNILECRASSAMSEQEVDKVEDVRASSAISATSHKSNKSHKSNCNEVVEDRSPSAVSAKSEKSNRSVADITTREEDDGENTLERPVSTMSAKSGASAKTNYSKKSSIKVTPPSTAEDEEDTNPRAPSVQSVKSKESRPASAISVKSTQSNVSEKCQNGGEEMRTASTLSVKSYSSAKKNRPASATSAKSVQNDDVKEDTRAPSTQSVKSNASAKECRPASANSTKSHVSKKSFQNENGEEETRAASALSTKEAKESRPASAISARSTKYHVSGESKNVKDTRAASALSEKSNASAKESRPASAISLKSTISKVSEKSAQNENCEEARAPTTLSAKEPAKESRPASAISVQSTRSKVSTQSENVEVETRAASAISVKSSTPAKESRPASAISIKSTKTNVSEKSQNVEEEARPSSVVSTKSNKSNKTTERALSPKSNSDQEGEERGGSVLSVKSAKSDMSAKSKCSESCKDEEKSEARTASVTSVKSSRTKKSSRASSPAKEKKEDDRATSAMSAKTHTSAISTKSKKSNHTKLSANVNEDDDKKSEKARSVKSAKSNTSRKFYVVTIKTPEVAEQVNDDDRPISSASAKTEKSNMSTTSKQNRTQKEDANESIVEDSAPKGRSSNRSRSPKQIQELMPENGEARGTSALSVCSGKSAKSSQNSEVATSKRRELEVIEHQLSQDSFASVSLVLPEDQDSESKTTTPEVTKSVENMDEVEQCDKNNPPAIDIPTIETPGEDEDNDASNEKIQVASSCSTKSAYSFKSNKSSCSRCGKLTTQADANGTDSPVAEDSIKSVSTTETSKLTVQDNKTASAMSSTSAKSQKKLQNDNVNANDTNQEVSRSATDANEEDKHAKSKSPCSLRPKSVASNQSSTKAGSKKGDSFSVKSSQNKEENAKPSRLNPLNCSRPASKGDTCSETILSHSLSAADLLKEAMANNAEPPQSPARSKASKASSSRPRSSKSQRRKKEEPDLTPSCLPNASPNDVVSDWLRSIPANSSMLALGDETHELEQDKDGVEKCVEDTGMENDAGGEEEHKDEDEKRPEESKEEEESPKEAPVETFEANTRPNTLVNDGSLPKSWHSSAAVMKVLLSSSLGRCRSMPEVSPVYGRRLSTSAKELLDCLTQLQLIQPANSVQKDQRPQFEDIIAILQSLWLTEPQDIVNSSKDPNGTDQVTPPRSSSGVGMSSGSGGSGKDNVNQEDDPKNDDVEVGQTHEEAKTDTAEEIPDSLKTNENPSSLDKNSKSPTDNEPDTLERSSSGSPPTVVRAPLTKHQSQDPDPVWVLHLLKKLEKQFINHYVNAMAEFKVRWDLEDSLILNKMIVELRDEVSQRIQSSVQQEMKKIQGRAGKGVRVPRPPPGGGLSRESTMTEKRRRLFKVIKNQSVKTGDSLSDSELTGDNSDQRSDDDYCPCEACMRKKMAARPLKTNPNAIEAPVQMEFDLLKILQVKKSPALVVAKPEPAAEEASDAVEEEAKNLEVVQEEEEDEESKMEDKTEADGVEEDCNCDCSKDEDDEETEESDKETVREKSSYEEAVEEAAKQTVSNEESTGAEEEEGGEEDQAEGEESEDVSMEERTSEQGGVPVVCVTEGEDADAEDSGTEEKSDTAGTTGDEDEESIEEETKNELKTDKKDDISLLHQFTRTSVESQSGSLEDIEDPPNVKKTEVRKLASPGGTGQKRSRSPARVKCRKAKNSDSNMANI